MAARLLLDMCIGVLENEIGTMKQNKVSQQQL